MRDCYRCHALRRASARVWIFDEMSKAFRIGKYPSVLVEFSTLEHAWMSWAILWKEGGVLIRAECSGIQVFLFSILSTSIE